MININNIKDIGYLSDEKLRLIIFLSYMDYFREYGPMPIDGTVGRLSTQAFNLIRYGNIEGKKEPEFKKDENPFSIIRYILSGR
ncbi:hypothetical protein HZP84_16050 [Elizabethkingia anophelis]|nr:hypothetical protein [Elizabethkingia anophelis]MCT3824971.1 hypothetical protein [Elizabethkingia anophelis]MCT3932276.1 hypothetical protein [Elizabethkingia anophelis]MCT4078342.1 hypothetical protein [Elizabethkingia anophelis]MCT4081642.1 hypothetical protein [Elizabethkingia anophelis]